MITRVDDRLRREASEFRLRFACESCVAFDLDRQVCVHEFPNQEHRAQNLGEARQIVFCKEFELA